jgi:hypothetical protein
VQVYLLRIEGARRPAFYAELPASADQGLRDDQGRPVRGHIERWLRGLKARSLKVVRRGPSWMQAAWNRFQVAPKPDESLVRVLRRAGTITLVHPSDMPPDRAQAAWRAYLRAKLREHGATLLWDLLLAPFVALLMVVPGPNVIGYILVYRLLVHVLALRGVVRVRLGRVPVSFEPSSVLNAVIPATAGPGDPVVEAVARPYGLEHLGLFLRRLQGRASSSPTSPSHHLADGGAAPAARRWT